jgi:hypothetical protein
LCNQSEALTAFAQLPESHQSESNFAASFLAKPPAHFSVALSPLLTARPAGAAEARYQTGLGEMRWLRNVARIIYRPFRVSVLREDIWIIQPNYSSSLQLEQTFHG